MEYKGKKVFNLQYAILGFISTGILAFLTNFDFNNIIKTTSSGVIQGAFSFITLGINTAFFEYLHKKFECKKIRIKIFSVLLPAFLSGFASYFIHKLNNSENPFFTAIGVFILASLTFTMLYLAIKKTNEINPIKLMKILIIKFKKN